ncbi:hypothetical protein APY04_0792 [Hyphomicrobium sulfonivorans]|uniref:Uncharacterized protein n=1 Tax=Hyphomicrobium sulfonivorans TaxID=121290 RepID=A0A109BKY5_HYPSL|nr:hypothetical protein [Hyphomicrobium sulfonivorans]KWT70731.1 hypothetical protein APY04_0792 [Hyphomicrobium sulfonivorans]
MKFKTATEEIDWLSGWRAALTGRPFDEHQTSAWLRGYRDYHATRLAKQMEVTSWVSLSVH